MLSSSDLVSRPSIKMSTIWERLIKKRALGSKISCNKWCTTSNEKRRKIKKKQLMKKKKMTLGLWFIKMILDLFNGTLAKGVKALVRAFSSSLTGSSEIKSWKEKLALRRWTKKSELNDTKYSKTFTFILHKSIYFSTSSTFLSMHLIW